MDKEQLTIDNSQLTIKPGYKITEVGVIPSDWEVKELGEIGAFKNGINKSSEDFGFGYPFVNLMDVFGKSSISQNENFGLINSNDIERKLYDLKKGDVLFIRSSVKPSGVGLTCVIENNLPNIVFSGFIIRYRDNNYLDEGYKRHCFYDERFRNNLIGSSTVSANTNINQEALKKLKISLPTTKAEQNLIATALSDADALISSLEKLIAKKRNIKQGAMQGLLSESGFARLKDKQDKDVEGKILQSSNPENPDSDKWEVKKLGEIGECIIGLTYTPDNVKESGTLVLRSSNVQGCSLKYDDNVYVDSKIPEKLINKENDILICVRNGSRDLIGKCALLKGAAIGETFGAFMSVFRSPFNEFVFILFQSEIIKKQIDEHLGATINQITNKSLNSFEIPFPSLSEQTHIATILSDMDAEITGLETKLEKYKNVKLGMMQNLLTGKIRLNQDLQDVRINKM